MAAKLQNNSEIPQERDVSFPPAHTAGFDASLIN